MKKFFFLIAIAEIIICRISFSQNTFPSSGSVGIGTTTPNSSSILEVTSTTKGVLFPRMTKSQRDAIASPAQGLVIYQTNNTPGLYYYNNGWSLVAPKSANKSLSNLTAPTAVNVDLLPGTTNAIDLGSASSAWRNAYFLGNVGVGTASPSDKFHVNGTGSLARFGTGTTATTYNYWYTGNDVGSFIEQQGNTTTAGSDKFRIQSSKSGLHADYSQFIIDPNSGFSFLSLGTGNGNVGIGSTTPGYKLFVTASVGITYDVPVVLIKNTGGTLYSDGLFINAGTNTTTGAFFILFQRPDGAQIGGIEQTSTNGVTYYTTSDQRLKNIIGASQKGLPDLMKINIYDYTFKSDPNKKVQTGFMAQELYEVFPQSVSKPRENNEPADKNPWMVDYGSVTPLIIKSVQEQQQMIDELRKINDEKDETIKNLQSAVGSLQKEVGDLKSSIINQQSSMSDGYVREQASPGVYPDEIGRGGIEGAILGQNIPNPFDNSTLIPFRIPKDCSSTSIMITNTSTSQVISVIPISCHEDHVSVDASTLASGTYSYALIVDGKVIGKKEMVITK